MNKQRLHKKHAIVYNENITTVTVACPGKKESEMAEIATLNQDKHYYTSTPELLQKYVEMIPPVDTQK